MPPKKESKGPAGESEELGMDPLKLLSVYQKYSKLIGLTAHPAVVRACGETEQPVTQLMVDDEQAVLGAGGCRALMTALLGVGPGMKDGPYRLLTSLRIWHSNIGDDGAASVAEVLRLGGEELQLAYLELIDNNISGPGCFALGRSLSAGANRSLLTLRLDFNRSLADDGALNLCRGLRTNSSLKQLHLEFCGITADGAGALGSVLSNCASSLEVLRLAGNSLRGEGLLALSQGLRGNTKLQRLSLADNKIEYDAALADGLALFRDFMLEPTCALTHVDLLFNRIGNEGATILKPALGAENKTVVEFLVDISIDVELFKEVFRRDAGGKKKKGKGGGGKKKK